jgi:hypothetical protein
MKARLIESLTKGDVIVSQFLSGTIAWLDGDNAWVKAFKPALDKFQAALESAPPAEEDDVPF